MDKYQNENKKLSKTAEEECNYRKLHFTDRNCIIKEGLHWIRDIHGAKNILKQKF